MATAVLHITKLTAAKRQLQAAIRMYFQPEDQLAVHTAVAAAAYGLLKDIKKSRGRSEAADSYLTAVFYAVRDFRRGTLPEQLTTDAAFMAEVERLASELSPITAESKLSDIKSTIGQQLERSYWNDTNKASNFLKHADRDADRGLNLDDIDNQLLLMKCFSAYQDVAPDDLGNEGMAFQAFICASNEAYHIGEKEIDLLVDAIRNVPEEQRGHLCFRAISELNARE